MPTDDCQPAKDGTAHRCPVEAFTEVVIAGSQDEARASTGSSRTRLAVVERGRPRSVVLQCPCGCGELLVLNVDRAAGSAWRLRRREGRITLMPSVWRTSGCRSHFILWENRVWLCSVAGDEDEPRWPEEMDAELRAEWSRIRTEMQRPTRR